MDNRTSINIPIKYQNMLTEVYNDSDGYWAYSESGYYFSVVDRECHVAHEDTQNQLLKVIRSLKPCECEDCRQALKLRKHN